MNTLIPIFPFPASTCQSFCSRVRARVWRFLFFVCLIAGIPIASVASDLEQGFKAPPSTARPHAYWLWINGHVDLPNATRELQAMQEAGLSGVLLFEMGGRGDAAMNPPVGPAFMSDAWVGELRKVLEVTRAQGLQLDMSVISSWDLGGPWVKPEHASMGLYAVEERITGGGRIDRVLPFPVPEPEAPLGPDGRPAFWTEIAVLAVREPKRLPAHTFVFDLDRAGIHDVTRVEFEQGMPDAKPELAATMTPVKKFRLAISTASSDAADFTTLLEGELSAEPGPQVFNLPAGTRARYVRLDLLTGHDTGRDRWTLGEFKMFDAAGTNVAGSRRVHITRNGALLLETPTPLTFYDWNTANINDGLTSGPDGVFCTVGLPPFDLGRDTPVVDLTDRIDRQGRLQWNAPEGEWTVMRYICMITGERLKIPSPASDGLATDHLNPAATRLHMDHVIGQLRKGLGDLKKSGISNLYLASYEVVGRVWSPNFAAEFERRRGYDLTRFLPAIFGAQIVDRETTERFLFDYEKTLGEVLVDAYYHTAREVAHAAGLTIKSEAGGPGPPIHTPPVDALLANSAVDSIQGEFWPHWSEMDGIWVVKETATAGHIYGKPIVHMEAFTSFHHWADGPQDLKPSADRVFTEGGNHFVWHTWTHQPPGAGLPGWAYHAGTHLNQNLIWWPQAAPFLDYLSRGSFLMQQGLFVADVLYYYGDGGGNFVPPRRSPPRLGPGYDYDVTNADVILNRLDVEGGRLVLPDGMSYAVLVLPEGDEGIHPEVLARIEQLVSAGATLIGDKPTRATGLEGYPASDERVAVLADRLWSGLDGETSRHRRHGKGQVFWGVPEREVLQGMGLVPDFVAPAELDFAHRRADGTELYFVRNQSDAGVSASATFRVTDRAPELWDPVSGRIERTVVHREVDGGIEVPLDLAPHGSTFVVFRAPSSPDAISAVSPGVSIVTAGEQPVLRTERNGEFTVLRANGLVDDHVVSELPAPLDLSTDWSLSFESPLDAPPPLRLSRTQAWTALDREELHGFSGTGIYRKRFTLPPGWLRSEQRVELDLGKVWAICEVVVNGEPLGIIWTNPFRIDVTDTLRTGDNEIVVRVSNTWHNRLVADARLGDEPRATRTNIVNSQGGGWLDSPWSGLKPIESGLIGPVRLVPVAMRPVFK